MITPTGGVITTGTGIATIGAAVGGGIGTATGIAAIGVGVIAITAIGMIVAKWLST